MPKIEPAVRQLLYIVPSGTSYIDLAKDLSIANRRLYRQGMSYVIQDIQVGISDGMRSTDVWAASFSTIPNSWISHNAWVKAFRTWKTQQDEFLDGMGASLKGKWADFKIYMDDDMAGGTTNALYAGDGAAYATGEWNYSNFVYDDVGTTRSPSIHMIGTSTDDTAIGLIEAYGDSRNYPTAGQPSNPAEISTGFYAQFHTVAHDDYNEDLGNDIRDQNDLAPYDQDDYPGGHSNADTAQMVRFVSCSGTQTTSMVPGFVAPCGLIKIICNEQNLTLTQHITDEGANVVDAPGPNSVYQSGTAVNAAVIITLAPGPYRGVLAAPMGQ